ncbi:MAG: alpha/beta fold hydrolase [Candidatus Promineifilaceae bacterium]|nr:alpha/beta fold hydrolase [Candidatus Promineifilaceae bacterium]
MSVQEYPPLPRHSVDVLGIHTSYYEAGEPHRPALLLLHGMSASADSFRELMHGLASDYWLVAPDIPGFGYSGDAEPFTFPHLVSWLEAFAEAVHLPPVHAGGHSFGGALGVSYALAHPGRVQSLVLLAPSVLRPGKVPQWLRSLARTGIAERIMELSVSASRLFLGRQMRAAFYDPRPYPDSLWERRAEDYYNSRASAAVLRASALHDLRPDLHKVRQPSCIIWGKEDPVLDPADARRLDEMMTGSPSTLHLLEECGHIPHIERRETVEQIVNDFLEELP